MPNRQLLLLRHAKAVIGEGSMRDIDRPLAPRGEKAAKPRGRRRSCGLRWWRRATRPRRGGRNRRTRIAKAKQLGKTADLLAGRRSAKVERPTWLCVLILEHGAWTMKTCHETCNGNCYEEMGGRSSAPSRRERKQCMKKPYD